MNHLTNSDTPWNHRLIRGFWSILLLYGAAATVGYSIELITISQSNLFYSLIRYHLMPGVNHLLIMFIGHLLFARHPGKQDEIVITWSVAISTNYLLMIPELYNRFEMMCLPVFLSSIYYQKKKVWYAYIVSLLCLILIFAVNSVRLDHNNPFDYIISLTFITASAIVGQTVMAKGWYLFKQLKESSQREQELMIRNKLAESLSRTDALTGLLNHRSFQEHCDDLMERFPDGQPYYLALMDVDNFKSINDTFGHKIGDKVLSEIGLLLKCKTSSGITPFRYGGEEFAVIFSGKHSMEVQALCNDILDKVHDITIQEIPDRSITISIGISALEKDMNKDEWFHNADNKLYHAKQTGKNKIVA